MEAKWHDSDDERDLPLAQAKSIHKKISRKTTKIASGLRELYSKGHSALFTAWSQKRFAQPSHKTQEMQLDSLALKIEKAHQTSVKKIAQTDPVDSLNAVVQSIDSFEDAFAFAGFDKIVKLVKLDENKAQKYENLNSIYLEGLAVKKLKFISKEKILCSFEKREFAGIVDSVKKKMTPIHKLFHTKGFIDTFCVSKDRNSTMLFNQNQASFLDNRIETVVKRSLHSIPIRSASFLSENIYAGCFENRSIKLFDIRKNITSEIDSCDGDFFQIAGNGNSFICGGKFGLVKLFDCHSKIKTVKEFRQLTTDISFVDFSRDFFAFGTAWKNNGVRVVEVGSNKIVMNWPNVKTRLGTVKAMSLSDRGTLALGNSLGIVSFFEVQ